MKIHMILPIFFLILQIFIRYRMAEYYNSVYLNNWAVGESSRVFRPIVNLSTGRIEGRLYTTTTNNKQAFVFQGIPYVEPPLGELRFSKPVSKKPWNGTLTCDRYKPACPQNISLSQYAVQDEDCLFMNIFSGLQCTQATPCPVLYYIHGGANEFESPNMFPVEDLVDNLASNGIVMVSVAYRLGVLGFFSTGTPEAVGNWALEDMVEGARWVQREIHNFGGDKRNVTVMGHSSSAMLVSLLTMSEKTLGLFHRAVMMSGSGTVWNAISNDVTAYVRLAAAVNCTTISNENDTTLSSSDEVLKCMRKVPASVLVNTFNDLRGIDDDGIFPKNLSSVRNDGPDGLFPKPLVEMIRDRRPIDILTGTTKNEDGLQKPSLLKAGPDTVARTCRDIVRKSGDIVLHKLEATNACIEEYVTDARLDQFEDATFPPWTEQVVELTEDANYFAPCFKECDSLRSKGSRVYLYSFDYEKRKLEGVYPWHAVDLSFVLGSHKLKFDSRDYQIQSRYAPLFVNFIKHGTPTPQPVDGVIWKPLSTTPSSYGPYLSVDLPIRLKREYHKNGVIFWNQIVPDIESVRGNNSTSGQLNLSTMTNGQQRGNVAPINFLRGFHMNQEAENDKNNATNDLQALNSNERQSIKDKAVNTDDQGWSSVTWTIFSLTATLCVFTLSYAVVRAVLVKKARSRDQDGDTPLLPPPYERYQSYNSF